MSTTTPATPATVSPAPTTAAEIHAAAIAAADDHVAELDAWRLASLAACGTPSDNTEGGDALDSARTIALEAISEHLPADPGQAGDWDPAEDDDVSDSVWQSIGGMAVVIYTYRMREAFSDLNGWEEDLAELGGLAEFGDFDRAATVAVFEILRRCAHAVLTEWADAYAGEVESLGGLPDDDDEDEN